jgi:RHH-type proline utilization regulon transcriptional repressor/proline dehydrogenase/delta 1-pyrroline-5-carboxylate dehydrogenase
LEKERLERLVRDSIELAETWQERGNALLSREEKRFQARMRRLLTHPDDKVIMTELIDQSFRSGRTRRVADQIVHLFKKWGVPRFFAVPEQMLTWIFLYLGKPFSFISIPLFIEQLRRESNRVILPGEQESLFSHLAKRAEEGVRMNLNHLGEAVLGEEEAKFRFDQYLDDLKRPEIDYISVKISTIYSQINSLSFDHTVGVLIDRLTRLFRTARENTVRLPGAGEKMKFVNLDMEEYRDLEITAEAFMKTLDQEELHDFSAGIVLQAYVPDSFAMQERITRFAKNRVDQGGAPIKIRIVKGANMEMEKIEAALYNWPLAPFDEKIDVDATFKKMVLYGMEPENIQAAHLGIASHNLFELAFAMTLAKELHVESFVSYEMLEGMADHIRRAIQENTGNLLLYAPVASRDQFISAIGYLIRRLDENTAKGNFLRHAPGLTTQSRQWAILKEQFRKACDRVERVNTSPRRVQDRRSESWPDIHTESAFLTGAFTNEPDTDWALKGNRTWVQAIREKWRGGEGGLPVEIPVVVAGKEERHGREIREDQDRCRLGETIRVSSFAMADGTDIDQAVLTARKDPDRFRELSLKERHERLARAAVNMRRLRGDLIGATAAATGKSFREADPEVSEAVDFLEFYPWSLRLMERYPNLRLSGKGVGLVISPWNFPIAIPTGGIAAALAAGNTVIFKPASSAVLPGYLLCTCFWDAGISENSLQFLPCAGEEQGNRLIAHPEIDFIIFTGGTDTALSIVQKRPSILFAGETGGKNATIVTAMADRDQAIKNVIHSAFSNCGQKCSATSLLILEKEVYDDPHFRKQLVDAAKSYKTGSVWDFENLMGPLIKPPQGVLKRALTSLDPGEEWGLAPENLHGNPYLYSPSIKWHVAPGSFSHMTEFFGPVLSVMRADTLAHAIDIANQTGYGLTSGLESLDKREQRFWKEKIRAGNLYINRGTTGAIVLRQPFGGMGKSAIGAGIKAGGVNYVLQFTTCEELSPPLSGPVKHYPRLLGRIDHLLRHRQTKGIGPVVDELRKTVLAVKNYAYAWEAEFSGERDYFHLRGQDNHHRYPPLGHVVIRIAESDSLFEILARLAAAEITGNQVSASLPERIDSPAVRFLFADEGRSLLGEIPVKQEADGELIKRMTTLQGIRFAGPDKTPLPLLEAAALTGFHVSMERVFMEGRIELLRYVKEQCVSTNYHRYGNLGERASEFAFF